MARSLPSLSAVGPCAASCAEERALRTSRSCPGAKGGSQEVRAGSSEGNMEVAGGNVEEVTPLLMSMIFFWNSCLIVANIPKNRVEASRRHIDCTFVWPLLLVAAGRIVLAFSWMGQWIRQLVFSTEPQAKI